MSLSTEMRRRRSHILVVAFAATLCVAPNAARATDLTVQSKYEQSVEFDTNPLLSPVGGSTLYGTVGMPELTIARTTGDSLITFDNRLEISRFNLPSYSSSDVHSTLYGKKSWLLSYFDMSGRLDYDTTRTSEFTNSGVNTAGVRHTGVTLLPEYGVSLSAIDQIVIDGSFTSATYGNPRIYQNYVNYGITPSFQRAFTARDTGSLILQTSHYNTTDGLSNSANTIGPALGWQRKLTPTVSFTVSAGYELVATTQQFVGSSTRFESFYSAQLQASEERDTFSFNSSRQETPQSSGLLVAQTAFGASENHVFNAVISDQFKINYQMTDYTTPIFGDESSFLEASNRLSYSLSQQWAVLGTLRYRREGRTDYALAGSSEAALINLVFTPSAIDFR